MEDQIKYIRPDAIVEMKVSAGYHAMMMSATDFLLRTFCSDGNGEIDMNKLMEANKQIHDNNIQEEWIYHYKTLLISILEFEKLVEKNGLLTTEPPTEDQLSS